MKKLVLNIFFTLVFCCLFCHHAFALNENGVVNAVASSPQVENVKGAVQDTSVAVENAGQDAEESLVKVLEFSEDGLDWRRDWWKVAAIVLSALIATALMIHLSKLILQLFGVVVCGALSLIAAFFLQSTVQPYIEPYAPDSLQRLVSLDYITLFLLFIVCFCVSAVMIHVFLNLLNSMKTVPSGKEEK